MLITIQHIPLGAFFLLFAILFIILLERAGK